MDDTDSDEDTPRPSGATNSDSHQTTSVSKSRLSGATNSDGHQTPSVSKSRLSGATNSDGHQTPSVSKYRLSGATNSDGHQTPSVSKYRLSGATNSDSHQTPSVSKYRLSGATNSDGHQTPSVSKSRLSGATNSDGHQTPSVSKSRPSFSKSRLSRDVKETIRIFESKSQGRTDVAEKSRRISEHVKDAKERFRLAVKTEGGRQPTQTSRNSSNKSTSNQSGQPPTKCDHAGQLKIFRGNLKTDNPRGQITLKDIPQLNLRADTDNEWPEEPIQRKTPTNSDNNNNNNKNNNNNNNSNNSLRLDLTTNTDNAGLPLRKPAAKNLLSERNKDKDYGNDVNDNTSPPLTPRCTPRTTSKRQDRFSYIPTPRRSEDKLPSLSLSAKEDIIKEIAPGLLLKPRDSELTSSRSSLASSASSLRSSVTSVISLTELVSLVFNPV